MHLCEYDPEIIVLNTGDAVMSSFPEHSIIMGKALREYVQEKGIQDRVEIPENGAKIEF